MFVLKFIIGIVVFITILLNFFRIVRTTELSSNKKLFNFLVFLLILIFLFQFGLSFTMHKSVVSKMGYPGEPGIRGQTGVDGNEGTCVADCGRKVCSTVLERDAHNALSFHVKKIRGNLKDGEILEKTLIKCAKGKVVEVDKNGVTIKLPKVELDICKKKPISDQANNNQSTSDQKVECISIEEVSDEVFGKKDMEIRYRIKNRLFLNKLKVICSSKQYLSTLEKEHKNKPTEKKLIEYLSSIIIKWIELIIKFKVIVNDKPVYLGVIFLMSPDATFDIIESIENSDGMITLDSPLREIEKYDIWKWGEITSESPLIVTKCISNQQPPLAIQQKLKTIMTNTYDVIFDSYTAYPSDVWDTTNCPYGQMGKKLDNPNNLDICINNTKTGRNGIIEKKLAWKTIEYRRKNNIIFLHPKKYTGKDGKIYYPLGSVWTTLKPNKDGKYGKKTLLVTGDIMPPEKYVLLWKSNDIIEDENIILKNNIVISMWRPVAPNGYIAFGDVVVKGNSMPSTNIDTTPIVCVSKSCVSQMPLGTEVWNTDGIARIDYRTEENYRIYNNISTNLSDNNSIDKDDSLQYPSNL